MRFVLRVNGCERQVEAEPLDRLLDVLREGLGLVAAKEGCGEGECGACTVLLDGRAACSCLVPVAQVQGAEITTVEGLASDPALHPLLEAIVRHGATQCGICTPGIVAMAAEMLRREEPWTRLGVREALAGNLCRCTGYQRIVDAVCEVLGAR